MKRALYDNIVIIPMADGTVVNRQGFLSAMVGITAPTTIAGNPSNTELHIEIKHSDSENGAFVPVEDDIVALGRIRNSNGKLIVPIKPGETVNICLDLEGCKQYIRVSPSIEWNEGGDTVPGCAIVLGDPICAPVNGGNIDA